MRAGWGALILAVALAGSTSAAVTNGSFTVQWDPPTDPRLVYELRWRSFAQSQWQVLPEQDARALTFTHRFPPLPTTPADDRWMCVDARSKLGDQVGPWLSDTSLGAACNTVEVGTVILPPPPPPPVIPPVPPLEIFADLRNANGVLSFSYDASDCPRGVQQRTSAMKDRRRTITLTCRR